MFDKLAIILVGEQNSGKTNTIRSYSDYYHKPVSTLKKGFRWDVTPFRPKYEGIRIWDIYFAKFTYRVENSTGRFH